MVKHTQTIRCQIADELFVRLALEGLRWLKYSARIRQIADELFECV